jgi:hypothetical protein
MKHKIVIIFLLIININPFAIAQEEYPCDKELIMRFLETVTAPNYKSTLRDFIKFFDGKATEIEGGLRHEYAITKGIELSWNNINTKSLAIDQFLNDTTIKRLIMIKKKKNFNWVIFTSHKDEISSIYVVGIEHTPSSFQIQFVKWPDSGRYGIREILGPTGESIYSSIYYK